MDNAAIARTLKAQAELLRDLNEQDRRLIEALQRVVEGNGKSSQENRNK